MRRREFSTAQFHNVARQALSASSHYIRNAQLNQGAQDVQLKEDKSIVTPTDKGSEAIARPIIQQAYPTALLNQEESGITGTTGSDIILFVDPLDGSIPFSLGNLSSTVLLSAYDKTTARFIASATMEPASGRFWFSAKDEGAWFSRFDYATGSWSEPRQLHVGEAILNGGFVLIDYAQKFSRKNAQGIQVPMLTSDGRRDLTRLIEKAGGREASYGTNGGHYAQLAMGPSKLAATVTSALGGPWDIGGLLHVEEAGGITGTYAVETDGNHRKLSLLPTHCVEKADFAIGATTPATLKALETILYQALQK